MYCIVSSIVKPQSTRCLLKQLNKHPGFYECSTNYHCQSGVYGHKPKSKKPFTVNKQALENRLKYSKLYELITAFREHGHKAANVNPIRLNPLMNVPELEVEAYGLDLEERCSFLGLINAPTTEGTVRDLVLYLRSTYCNTLSAEFQYLEELEEREWFADRFESISRDRFSEQYKKGLMREMLKSQALDKFLASKFVSLKRYGGEGAESMLAFFIELFNLAALDGIKQLVVGAHHRGRLNLLTGLLKMPPQLLFRKLQGKSEFPDDVNANGDVISHLCPSENLDINGSSLHVIMTNLPSHLEAVNPVSMGKTRCLQQIKKEAQYGNDPLSNWSDTVLNVQVHGDAALMGQGIAQESLLLSGLPHFYTGGSIHLIVNNQIGFTTPPYYGRGTNYPSDIAKLLPAPVLHVNAENPEDVTRATRVAVEYQRKFRKNVFIDLNCYRRWGHNELDDPTFTDPLLYALIREKRTIPDIYASHLTKEGIVSKEEVADIEKEHMNYLNGCLKIVDSFVPSTSHLEGEWKGYMQAPNAITVWDTGVDTRILQLIGAKSVSYPDTFNIHPTLQKHHIQGRLSKLYNNKPLDWATAEALAFGSLLYEGYNVRISGQDVGRGTFSHRHVMFVDQKTDDIYVPLNHITPKQEGFLEVANSPLSEEAVLGFEYGFSTMSPRNLVIWEAQFGDFFNGAQIQIDTYVTSGESKWLSLSGLVILLPHGYDGAGPEHSSCRPERFLQLSDSSETRPDGEDVNFHIVNPTTPAQYFHLLRRQMVRNYRKPLVVITPKTLLRSSDSTSMMDELAPTGHFRSVIADDGIVDADRVRRIIFVTGKHYFALNKYRERINARDVAIVRLEELCPFPTHEIRQEISKFRNAKEFVWSQEEPRNMGAWAHCRTRFENLVGRKVVYAGREALAAPAVGIGNLHNSQADWVLKAPFHRRPT